MHNACKEIEKEQLHLNRFGKRYETKSNALELRLIIFLNVASYWLYDSSFYIKTFERAEKCQTHQNLKLYDWMVQDSAVE